jgi:hypothetical protein
MSNNSQFMARVGSDSAVFPSITVRYSRGTYTATAKWDDLTARGMVHELPSEWTASEAAVRAAWQAHVNLALKVCAPREGEDGDFWNARLTERIDVTRYTAIVIESVDSRGGYIVSFMDRCDVVSPTD